MLHPTQKLEPPANPARFSLTFAEAGKLYLDAKLDAFRNEKHRYQWRYCHGIDHRFQWKTHREFADAMEVYIGKGELHRAVYSPPDDGCGYGYRYSDAPHQDCPECDGEGEPCVRFKDTRLMTDDERKFFVGVKQTKHGIEFKFNDQMAALKELAKRLGFYEANDDRNTNAVARLILDLQSRGQIERMPLRRDRDPRE